MGRIVLCTKDVEHFTGKSNRASRHLLNKIRLSNNKTPSQPVTIFEFAKFHGIKVEMIANFIR